jgi:hypothetical protein
MCPENVEQKNTKRGTNASYEKHKGGKRQTELQNPKERT